MAKTAWQCSQCGAINEPGSRSCQNCGKWPSLFDLQDSVVEEPETVAVEDKPFEVETFEAETFEPEPFEPGTEADEEPPQARWKSILSGVVVPLALLVYFVIAFLSDR